MILKFCYLRFSKKLNILINCYKLTESFSFLKQVNYHKMPLKQLRLGRKYIENYFTLYLPMNSD